MLWLWSQLLRQLLLQHVVRDLALVLLQAQSLVLSLVQLPAVLYLIQNMVNLIGDGLLVELLLEEFLELLQDGELVV